MQDNFDVPFSELFVIYAMQKPERWKLLIDQEINHVNLGLGKVRSADEDYIEVDFYESEDNPKTFKSISINKYFNELCINSNLGEIEEIKQAVQAQRYKEELQRHEEEKKQAEIKAQQEKELAAKKHFEQLKAKYHVENRREISPVSMLYTILLHIDNDEQLEAKHTAWLKLNKLFKLLALYHKNRYKKSHDPWELIKEASCWRNIDPEKTLKLSEKIFINHPNAKTNIKAAALTIKGGAYRDLNDLESAQSCAYKALEYYVSFYPYNLLGAIAFQLGNLEEGERFFQKSEEFGASKKDQQDQMVSSLKKSEPQTRVRIAQYLLERDPQKYHWAHFYLETE